jgi:hypothetical protein
MKIDFSKGIQSKREATTSGRYYKPVDELVARQFSEPLKPSWTNISSCESSPGLSQYFKDKGRWADIDGPTTAIIGTITHQAVDDLNLGKKINTDWIVEALDNYHDIRWKLVYPNKWEAVELIKKQIMGYQEWYWEHQPTILQSEIMMWHPDVPYAGTADLVLNIYNKRQKQDTLMLADLKTGNEQDKHFEQCMAYAILLEKIYKVKVSTLGVLYCQGRWRGAEAKPGKMKVKVVRNKSGEYTSDANYLMNRVVKVYECWKSNQKTSQPTTKPRLPNEFSLTKPKKGKI